MGGTMKRIKTIAAVGLVTAACQSMLFAPAAQAKDVPDSLKQEACQVMDSTELTGDPMMNYVASLLMAAHRGLDEGSAGWAIIHGVQKYCPWHKNDLPAWAKKYV
jgi:hypothetical protein